LSEFERIADEQRELDQEPEAAPEIRQAFYKFYQGIYRKAVSRVAGMSSKEVLSIDRSTNQTSPLQQAPSLQQDQFPEEYSSPQTSFLMEHAKMQIPNPPMPVISETAPQSHE
jgi:hypothetical protein